MSIEVFYCVTCRDVKYAPAGLIDMLPVTECIKCYNKRVHPDWFTKPAVLYHWDNATHKYVCDRCGKLMMTTRTAGNHCRGCYDGRRGRRQ